MKPKGRRIAIVVTTLGIGTAAVAGFLLRGQIVERWYLHKLEAGTPDERKAAIEKLGKVGSEAALIGLHDRFVQINPEGLRVGWCFGSNGENSAFGASLAGKSSPFPGDNERLLLAITQIEQRLGVEREFASYLQFIHNEAADPKTRVYLSAHIILGTADPLLHPLSKMWGELLTVDSSHDWSRFAHERPAVIKVLISLIRSGDELSRGAAIHALGWCGSEAMAGIPAIEKAANEAKDQDPQPGTWTIFTEAHAALKKIRGE
jgi:hypothetical protein